MKSLRLVVIALAICTALVQAQVPRTLSFQGVLTDTLGKAKPDGPYSFTFRFYEVSSGGSALWAEPKTLQVKRGLFQTILGDQVALGSAIQFDKRYWLGIQVAAEPELAPRIELTSVGASLRAGRADTAMFALNVPQQAFVDSARVAGTVAEGAVTSAKLANGAVTGAKISSTGASVGQALTWNGSSVGWGTPIVGGIWQQAGGNLYYSGGNVGIGTASPSYLLDVKPASGDALIGISAPNDGSSDARLRLENAGQRIWHMYVDRSDTGKFKIAKDLGANSIMVLDPTRHSVAMGDSNTKAPGLSSTAMGYATRASGAHSTAMGWGTIASGNMSTAMGSATRASGMASTAMGANANAFGDNSTAMGSSTTAIGGSSTAMGSSTNASGDNSTAMGYNVSTNGQSGSFIIGDVSFGNPTKSTAPNQFSARFSGGYVLYTNSTATVGVQLTPGANMWAQYSDSTRKENFKRADGEYVLESIRHFRLGSWNYKGQDPSQYRHYGPMAQEFHAAFGHDGMGVAGDDTTINEADFNGINMIAIQAMEKRTAELKENTAQLEAVKAELSDLKSRVARLEEALKLPKDYAEVAKNAPPGK
jgi:hypothetical protein